MVLLGAGKRKLCIPLLKLSTSKLLSKLLTATLLIIFVRKHLPQKKKKINYQLLTIMPKVALT